MQGKLVPPPDLRQPGDPTAESLHREALGEHLSGKLASERTWMQQHECQYWLPGKWEALKRLGPEAPGLLFLRGGLDLSAPSVAIVGARKADQYGLEMATRLGRALGRAGVVVVSGGALGIDRAAHEGAIEGGGRTLVVLAGGLAEPHPPGNVDLFDRVLRSGSGILSEHPVGRPASRWTFPHRNRLISALADAVVVVQAGRASGALVTADWALKLDVPLFAVPADAWYLESRGTIDLLGKGAAPLACPSDLCTVPFLAELTGLNLPWPRPVHRPRGLPSPWKDPGSGPVGNAAYRADSPLCRMLREGPASLDELVEKTGIPAGRIQALLLDLEISGQVARIPGGVFMLVEGSR